MAADPTLYQGAYRAAMSDSSISKPMVDAQGMQQLAEILRDAISNKKKGQGNYDKELQKVLDDGGALSAADKAKAHEIISGENYDQYVNGNKQQQKQALDKMNNMQKQYGDYTKILYNFAAAKKHKGLSNSFLGSEKDIAISSLSDPSGPKLEQMDNEGNMGVRFTDWELISETESTVADIENEIFDLEEMIGRGYEGSEELKDLYSQRSDALQLLDSNPTKLNSLQELEAMIKYPDQTSIDALTVAAKMEYDKGFNIIKDGCRHIYTTDDYKYIFNLNS